MGLGKGHSLPKKGPYLLVPMVPRLQVCPGVSGSHAGVSGRDPIGATLYSCSPRYLILSTPYSILELDLVSVQYYYLPR